MRTGKFPQQSGISVDRGDASKANSGVWQLVQKRSIASATTNVLLNGLDDYTKLMLHFNGADAAVATVDAAALKAVTFVGTAQIDTAQKKFGNASLLLDGNSDYISLADSDDWNFGTGNFTIDFWARFNSVGDNTFFSQYLTTPNEENRFLLSGGLLYFLSFGGGAYTIMFSTPFAPNTNQWYHIALVRKGNSNSSSDWAIYIDGVAKTGGDLTLLQGAWNGSIYDVTGPFYIGATAGSLWYFDGWLDEFRVSKGIARWNGNFTPPTQNYGINGDDDVEYKFKVRNICSGTGNTLLCRVNGDSGNNYGFQYIDANNTTVASGNSAAYSAFHWNGTVTNNISTVEFIMAAKTGQIRQGRKQVGYGITGTTVTAVNLSGACYNNSTVPVTMFQISDAAASTDIGVGSEFELYARRSTL